MSQALTKSERAKQSREMKKQFMSKDANQFRNDVSTFANLAYRTIEAAVAAGYEFQKKVADGEQPMKFSAGDILVQYGNSQISAVEMLQDIKKVIEYSGERGLGKTRVRTTTSVIQLTDQGVTVLENMVKYVTDFFNTVSPNWRDETGGDALERLMTYVQDAIASESGQILKFAVDRLINIYITLYGVMRVDINDETFKISISESAGFGKDDIRRKYNTIVRALPLYLANIGGQLNPLTDTIYRSAAAAYIRRQLGRVISKKNLTQNELNLDEKLKEATRSAKLSTELNRYAIAYLLGDNETLREYSREERAKMDEKLGKLSVYTKAKLINSLEYIANVVMPNAYPEDEEFVSSFQDMYNEYASSNTENIDVVSTDELQ